MKKIIWSLILALVLYHGFIGTALAQQETSPPDIEFSEELWDFGPIKQGEEYTTIVKLKNWGEKEIKIASINSSSDLITAVPASKEIRAGEEGEINVNLDIGGETGKIQEYLYLTVAIPLEAVIGEK